MKARIFRILGALALCTGTAFAAPPYAPKAVPYDPARLHDYTDFELIDLLSTESSAQNSEPHSAVPPKRHSWDDAADELVARRATRPLLKAFAQTTDHFQLYPIADVLARIADPAADAALHRYVINSSSDTNMVATEYFGKRCEPKALAILNHNFEHYSGSSLEHATIADIFGNCRYRPATPILVRWVAAASLNLGIAAQDALTKIYPDARIPEGRTPEECATAWRRYIAGLRAKRGR